MNNLFPNSEFLFNCIINDNVCYENMNIYFACNFLIGYQDEKLIEELKKMSVCTFKGRASDKNVKVFKQ
jgi:hypothetical protein